MTAPYSLLLDLGGTYIKVAKCNHVDWKVFDEISFAIPAFVESESNRREIDPTTLMNSVNAAITDAVGESPPPESIFVSGQMASWILTDSNNCPITNVVSWQDNSSLVEFNGSRPFDVFSELLTSEILYSIGYECKPGTPSSAIFAQQTTGLVPLSTATRFHTLLSWVASQLTTSAEYIMHVTDAASSGMFDIRKEDWSASVIDLVAPSGLSFPSSVTAVKSIGKHKTFFCPIFSPIGDQQAALLGAELRNGQTAFNIATGGQVARLVDHCNIPDVQLRPFYGSLFIATKTHLPAGRVLSLAVNLLVDKECRDDPWTWADRVCEIFDKQALPKVDLGFFTELGGGWSGVTSGVTRESMIQAVVSAISDAYIDSAFLIGHENTDCLLFCGGVAQNFISLRNEIASAFRGGVHVAPSGDMALKGLAKIAKTVQVKGPIS